VLVLKHYIANSPDVERYDNLNSAMRCFVAALALPYRMKPRRSPVGPKRNRSRSVLLTVGAEGAAQSDFLCLYYSNPRFTSQASSDGCSGSWPCKNAPVIGRQGKSFYWDAASFDRI
jgi:hypothetical protein